MKTLILFITLSLLCSTCHETGGKHNGNNDGKDTTTIVTTPQKDTIPNFIIADSVYDEGYVILTCKSMQIDTSAQLSVCPIVVIDSTEGNSLLILVSSNRKDMLKLNTCNIIADGKQYPTHFEKKMMEKNYLEVLLFSSAEMDMESVSLAKEISFAFWGDYGSVMYKTTNQQADEFITLVMYK